MKFTDLRMEQNNPRDDSRLILCGIFSNDVPYGNGLPAIRGKDTITDRLAVEWHSYFSNTNSCCLGEFISGIICRDVIIVPLITSQKV